MAKLQWVIVGVMRTVTVLRGESGLLGRHGLMDMSGRDTTAKAPKDIGCSGSDIVDMRSYTRLADSKSGRSSTKIAPTEY